VRTHWPPNMLNLDFVLLAQFFDVCSHRTDFDDHDAPRPLVVRRRPAGAPTPTSALPMIRTRRPYAARVRKDGGLIEGLRQFKLTPLTASPTQKKTAPGAECCESPANARLGRATNARMDRKIDRQRTDEATNGAASTSKERCLKPQTHRETDGARIKRMDGGAARTRKERHRQPVAQCESDGHRAVEAPNCDHWHRIFFVGFRSIFWIPREIISRPECCALAAVIESPNAAHVSTVRVMARAPFVLTPGTNLSGSNPSDEVLIMVTPHLLPTPDHRASCRKR
jgi:hypothetical protein